MKRTLITADVVKGFPEVTIDETWACFEVFRRWNYPSRDIYVVIVEHPARHVVVSLMNPGTHESMFNLYAGKLTTDADRFMWRWRDFSEKASSGVVEQFTFKGMWERSRVLAASAGLSASMVEAGLTPHVKAS